MATKKQSVGVIGLGLIGTRVAAGLRKAGFEVWVWNRTPRAEPNFLASPAEVAETADVLQIFVSDGAALIETMEALRPALSARHIVLNHATVSPAEAKTAAEIAANASAGFLDAPFTGSRDGAENAALVYYVGGPPDLLYRVQSVLDASSRRIVEIGGIGQASLVKIATNVITAATIEALAEALALLDRNGVPPAKFAEAFQLNASRSVTAEMKLPCMLSGDFDARFALKHMFKDVQLALGEAQALGIELPACAATAGALMAAMHHGWADLDFSAVAKHYEFAGKYPLATFESFATASDDADLKKEAPRKRFSLFGSWKSS